MISADDLILAPIENLQDINGVPFPEEPKFRQFLITGPPGAGKSTLVGKMRGWPYEGYVDLSTSKWWRVQTLTFRPRELHLGAPFKGYDDALTVLDNDWLEKHDSLEMDFRRIQIPPGKKWFFGTDWRTRYVFEFILPSADRVYQDRIKRAKTGLFPFDRLITPEIVTSQVEFYRTIAWYFWSSGMHVYVRVEREGPPMEILDCKNAPKSMTDDSQKIADEISAEMAPKPSLFRRISDLFSNKPHGELLTPTSTPAPLTTNARIAWTGQPFQLTLGNIVLEFHPDLPISGNQDDGNRDWILHPGCAFYEGAPKFIRIKPEETIQLGRMDGLQDSIFGFDNSVAARHVRIFNHGGQLTIQPLEPDLTTSLSVIDSPTAVWEVRRENLTRLPGVLGHDLVEFDDVEALDIIRSVNEVLAAEAYRELNDEGDPGGIIHYPDDMTVVIMGDVHARVDNILRVITEGGLLAALERGEACLIFLGDLIHSEEDDELEDMGSSVLIIDLFCMLKRRFPENIFYIHGNHESFSPDIGKSGIPQGLLMRNLLKKRRGKAYVAEVEKLFDGLAFIVHGNEFAACHGGPARSKVTHETLVNIRRYPGLQAEIVWNRLRQGSRVAGYGKGSVKRLRRTLGLSDDAALVVGHSPMSAKDTIWLNVGGIEGHHILFSAHTDRVAAMLISDGNVTPLEFVPEPALDFLNDERDP